MRRTPPWTWTPDRASLRIELAVFGLVGVAAAEVLRPSGAQGVLADVGVGCLLLAALLALFPGPVRSGGSPETPLSTRPSEISEPLITVTETVSSPATLQADGPTDRRSAASFRSRWRLAQAALVIGQAAIAQTWFRSGTAVAGGDIAPPEGTAWISRMFASVAWSGSNLGSVNQAQQRLPWGAVLWLTHLAGGSGALAQRIWLTALLVAVALAAAALARALGLSPLAGVAAGMVFVWGPYLMSIGGISDVYLLAMVLLAAVPAVVVAGSRGSMPRWAAAICLGLAAPLVGYVYANPPLVGMVIGALLVSVLLVWVRYGRQAARRSVPVVLGGGALLAAFSTYWAVPARIALRNTATSSLAPLSTWIWTESRATLANALWLNNAWNWRYSYYVPYNHDFSHLPLSLLRVLLPVVAFLPLALPVGSRTKPFLRLTGAVALGALLVVVLSTGTRPPGDFLFDKLYELPYGWLLEEPGRFLMVAGLGFALLAGLLVDAARGHRPKWLERLGRGLRVPARRFQPTWSAVAFTAVVLVAAGSFPLWTGEIVPGPRPPFPSSHVKFPHYWQTMADWLNSRAAPSGALLALPPDDFYAMPYTWYYGNDGFITDLVARHVVDPSSQGYDKVSNDLLDAVHLEAKALVARDWTEAARLLGAMGTPLVLVRGDIDARFPSRSIVSPALLDRRLRADPRMHALHGDGPLIVYGVRPGLRGPTGFATVDSASPDLRALTLVPRHTALVSSPPVPGHIALFQLPPVATWQLDGSKLTTTIGERTGWSYRVANLALAPDRSATSPVQATSAVQTSPTGVSRQGATLRVSVPVGHSVVSDGTFSHGLWGPVGNCDDAVLLDRTDVFRATDVAHGGPGGTPMLQLAANVDGACESQTLAWYGGSLLVRMDVRSQSGAAPSLCIWEEPEHRCAPASALPSSNRWEHYDAVVTPAPLTRTLSLVLYAYSTQAGQLSVEDYSGVVVKPLPAAPLLAVVATPTRPAGSAAIHTALTGFATGWTSASGGRHVEVDGLRNGWIVSSGRNRQVEATYEPVRHDFPEELTDAAISILAAAGIGLLTTSARRRRQGRAQRRITEARS